MNISSVSSSVNNSYASTNSDSSEISSLEKKKATLNTELQKEEASKDDAKTKSTKVAAIQAEIQTIDAEIQARRSSGTSKTSQKEVDSSTGENSSLNKDNINAEKSRKDSDNIIDVYA